jgi:hypothetical protein
MPVFYPDILEHNNNNRALVDITELRGNAYPLNSLSDTGSIPEDKRKVGAIVFVTSSGAFYGFSGTTSSLWNDPTKWGSLGGGGVTGGAPNYIAVWSGSTSLTTGSLYNDINGVGINNTSPSYSLDVNGDISVNGLSGLIYHQKNKHGVIAPTEVQSGSSATLLSFEYIQNDNYTTYRGLFFDYEIALFYYFGYNREFLASRSGTLKAAIYYRYTSNVLSAIQTNENTTQEYFVGVDTPIGTENITLTLEFTTINAFTNVIVLKCNNLLGSGYLATIRGEWKLLPNN